MTTYSDTLVIIIQLFQATSVGYDLLLWPQFLLFQVRIPKKNYETMVDNIDKTPLFTRDIFLSDLLLWERQVHEEVILQHTEQTH